MDRWLGGAKDTTPAGNIGNVPIEQIEEALPNKFFDSTAGEVKETLQRQGAGARGILAFGEGSKSHMVNVINFNGEVLAIDGQNMTYGTITDVVKNSGYRNGGFMFMLTYIPR